MIFLNIIKTLIVYIKKNFQHLKIINDRIDANHTFMLASGIAFNIIVYMLPLFLLAIYLVQNFFDMEMIISTIENLINSYMPDTKSNYDFIHNVMDELKLITQHSALFGWIGLIGLLYISSTLVSSIRTSLNKIFDISSERFFLIYWLKDIFLTIIVSILILIYSYALPIVNFVIDLINSFTPMIFEGVFSWVVLSTVSVLTSFVLFIFIFYFVPNKKPPKRVSLMATVISVIGIEASRYIFTWYISSLSNYGKFYGTYAVIISMAVWIYYSAVIILLSAEISKYIYDLKLKAKYNDLSNAN